MNEKESPAEKAPAIAPKERGPKVWKYVGPQPAALVSNLPGTGQKYRADSLPQAFIPFLIETNPEAKAWYE